MSDPADLILESQPLNEPVARLAKLIGMATARAIFQRAFRDEQIQGIAERFVCSGTYRDLGKRSGHEWPDVANCYPLPSFFWTADFSHDGETNQSRGKRIAYRVFADWRSGHFSIQHTTPGDLSMRSAQGVRVLRVEAAALIAQYSGTPSKSPSEPIGNTSVTTGMTYDELASWINACGLEHQDNAFLQYRSEAPPERQVKRTFFREVWRALKARGRGRRSAKTGGNP